MQSCLETVDAVSKFPHTTYSIVTAESLLGEKKPCERCMVLSFKSELQCWYFRCFFPQEDPYGKTRIHLCPSGRPGCVVSRSIVRVRLPFRHSPVSSGGARSRTWSVLSDLLVRSTEWAQVVPSIILIAEMSIFFHSALEDR